MHKKLIILTSLIVALAIFIFLLHKERDEVAPRSVEPKNYDVVVVGGGPAGLTAAYHLRSYNMLLLEKEDRLGGRVLTKKYDGERYELGAVFQYNPEMIPLDFIPSDLIHAKKKVGIQYADKVLYGDSMEECIASLPMGEAEEQTLNRIVKREGLDSLKPETARLINSLFQVIHPGNILDYSSVRRSDLFVTWDTSRRENGNSEFVEFYRGQMGGQFRLGAEVVSIEDKNSMVEVIYREGGETKSLSSKFAINTTAAPIAREIVRSINERTSKFLDEVKYAPLTVIALVYQNAGTADFSYVVTPDYGMNMVIKVPRKNRETSLDILIAYYTSKHYEKHSVLSDKELTDYTDNGLRKLGIIDRDVAVLKKSDVLRWKLASTIISDAMLSSYSKEVHWASGRIYLAGDYTFVDEHIYRGAMPYGLSSAMISGKVAADEVKKKLMEL